MTNHPPASADVTIPISLALSYSGLGGYAFTADAPPLAGEHHEPNEERINVLLIDDGEHEFFLCSDMLAEAKDHPFRLHWEADPEQGLKAMASNQYDLYLLDYRLGRMNGLEVLQQAMAEGCTKPIILMTGFGSRDVDKQAIRLGAADYLPKNYLTPALLESALRHAVERAKLQANLIENERRFRAIFENAFQHILLLNAEGTVLDVNQTALNEMGFMMEDVLGKHLADLPWGYGTGIESGNIFMNFEQATRGLTSRCEITTFSTSGSRFVLDVSLKPLHTKQGDINLIILEGRDITERKEAEQVIAYQAFHDALTGLPNRALFHNRLAQALREARRTQEIIGVAYLDLDRFKFINDTLGHDAGDELLIQVAQRLEQCVRDCDTVARLGGDEFVIILRRLFYPRDAIKIAERILNSFSTPFLLRDEACSLTTSVGIAVCSHSATTAETLIKHADAAMYQAKEAGKNRYMLFDKDLNQAIREQLQVEAELQQALEQQEFVLHYQPQIDLKTGKVTAAEALLRWNHPERGLIMPGEFIPLAEHTGLIVKLGAWVLHEACRQNVAWQHAGLTDHRVAVNVSALQFGRKDLFETVKAALDASGLNPQYLELELTESLIIRDVDIAIEQMNKLKALGVSIAIDDFGKGHSSLTQLRRLPLDKLKIDRSFVHELGHKTSDSVLVQSITVMAHSLGLKVIAEGVETHVQHEHLTRLAPDELQGFLFSKPLPQEAYARWFIHDFS
jgi:diguanylate cyclase (GGDEF)-like protein/PAS domain S-box-containing protein